MIIFSNTKDSKITKGVGDGKESFRSHSWHRPVHLENNLNVIVNVVEKWNVMELFLTNTKEIYILHRQNYCQVTNKTTGKDADQYPPSIHHIGSSA